MIWGGFKIVYTYLKNLTPSRSPYSRKFVSSYFQIRKARRISYSSETYEDQDLSNTSQFALDVEDPDDKEQRLGQPTGGNDANFEGPYMDEPLADEEWLQNCNRQSREDKDRQRILTSRLDGTEPVNTW